MTTNKNQNTSFSQTSITEQYHINAGIVLWLIWFVLLVSTPFFIESHDLPSVFSSAYAFIAVGFLAGVLTYKPVNMKFAEKRLTDIKKIALIAGLIVTAILVVPEWYFHLRAFAGSALSMEKIAPYVPLMVVFADIPQAPFGDLSALHHILLFVSGLCCAFVGAAGDKALKTGIALAKEEAAQEKHVFAIAGLFACGALHPGIWGWLAHTYGTDWDDAVMHDLLGFMGSSIFALTVSIGLAFILYWGNRKLKVQTPGMLTAFALGELAWNLIARCGNAIENIVLVAPVASVLLAFLEGLLLILFFRNKPPKSGSDSSLRQKDSLNSQDEPNRSEIFNTSKLTDREKQAIELALQGLNSNEAAEIVGVKASTVRTYLHRAYQKLEIEGIDEIRSGNQASHAYSSNPENQEAEQYEQLNTDNDSSGKVETLSSACPESLANKTPGLDTPLFILIAGMFLLPHQYVGTIASWNSSHSVVIGCGLGLMMAGGLLSLARPITEERKVSSLAKGFCLLFLIASGIAFVSAQYFFAHQLSALGQSAQLFLLGATAACFSFFLGLSSLIRTHTDIKPSLFGFVCVLVTLLLLASYLSDQIWATLCLFSLLAFVGPKALELTKTSDEQAKAFTATSFLSNMDKILFALASLPLGVIAGELWRGLQNPLLLVIYVCFFIFAFVLMASVGTKQALAKSASVLCFIILVGIATVADIPHALLILCAFVFLQTRVIKAARPYIILGLGAGFSLGRLGFDAWRDLLGTSFTTTESFGTNIASAALAPALMAVLAVIGLACILYLNSLYSSTNQTAINSNKEERDVLFLRSKGINELEALILAKIAQGMTGPQIARSLHYSLGAVNSLRAHGYRTLAIHSKQELVDLLK